MILSPDSVQKDTTSPPAFLSAAYYDNECLRCTIMIVMIAFVMT